MDKIIVERDLYPSITSHLESDEITVLIGPRQVGKTTLLNRLKNDLLKKYQPQDIHYFNLDVVSDMEVLKDQPTFIRFLKNRLPNSNKMYVFVDEAQRIQDPGLFFKGVYDLGLPVKLILTGSSTLEIKSKILEPLTGRKKLFKLYPLNFKEFVSISNKDLLPFMGTGDEFAKTKLLELLNQFLLFGGYPKVALEPNHEVRISNLQEIYTSYLERDISGFLKVKNAYLFSQMVRILSEETGDLVNIETMSQELGVKNETIGRYMEILEETFITKRVLPFYRSTRTEIRKMPKIYFVDAGIRNFALYQKNISETKLAQQTYKGKVLENFILSELIKADFSSINFWRTKDGAEVDFIVNKGSEIIPVEVKSTSNVVNVSRSFVSFIKKYNPKSAIIVTMGQIGSRKVESTNVEFKLPYQVVPYLESL